jgi:hypothetical protein
MAHDQVFVGSNPGTVYCKDISDLKAITLKKFENKGSQIGHKKTHLKQKKTANNCKAILFLLL